LIQRMKTNGIGYAIIESPNGTHTGSSTGMMKEHIGGKLIARSDNSSTFLDKLETMLGYQAAAFGIGTIFYGIVYGIMHYFSLNDNNIISAALRSYAGFTAGLILGNNEKSPWKKAAYGLIGATVGAASAFIPENEFISKIQDAIDYVAVMGISHVLGRAAFSYNHNPSKLGKKEDNYFTSERFFRSMYWTSGKLLPLRLSPGYGGSFFIESAKAANK
jgi:hypothetical protein